MERADTAHAPRSAAPRTIATIAALLLAVGLLDDAPSRVDAAANAAPPSQGLTNPADQRNDMIAELRRINERLEALQRTIEKGTLRVQMLEAPSEGR